MHRSNIVSASLLITLFLASGIVHGQGRGQIPQLPPQSQDPGRFPGFPPNAGTGQPTTPGRPPIDIPQPNENADPRAFDGADNAGLSSNQLEAASVEDLLDRTPELAGRLTSMLPAGTDLQEEAGHFRNLGGLVSSVMVWKNLRLGSDDESWEAFRDLVTAEDGSLGAAIQASDPQLTPEEANQAASDAEEEAEELIEETS